VNAAVKALVGLIAAAAVVYVLFTWVFPWVDENLITDPTMDAAPARVLVVV
jgi:hypothetical protein